LLPKTKEKRNYPLKKKSDTILKAKKRSFFPALFLLFTCPWFSFGQADLTLPFKECHVDGSITIYDYKKQRWIYSDTADAFKATQPASTFKVINLLIALETGVIKDEKEIVQWPGHTDTVLYGYRPEIYKDMTVEEAFKVSAGWVFIELAKRVGRARYARYLKRCNYGNGNLSETGTDFWNFGAFAISPVNQVNFLVRVYKDKVPFSKRNTGILKKVMITETNAQYTLRSKTGWTRADGNDAGWWVGYVERKDNVYFFATRLIKKRSDRNPGFGDCRKSITKDILNRLNITGQAPGQ
jgi:beta-lactamase class D